MGKKLELSQQRFGRLTAISFIGLSSSRKAMWRCKCDCGAEINAISSNLINGNTASCGCFKIDQIKKIKFIHGRNQTDPTYGTWYSMRQRCMNPNSHKYPYYGAVGITICQEWNDFLRFINDMGERPSGKTLDRINPYGNYEPSNCRWATAKEQRANQRSSIKLDVQQQAQLKGKQNGIS